MKAKALTAHSPELESPRCMWKQVRYRLVPGGVKTTAEIRELDLWYELWVHFRRALLGTLHQAGSLATFQHENMRRETLLKRRPLYSAY